MLSIRSVIVLVNHSIFLSTYPTQTPLKLGDIKKITFETGFKLSFDLMNLVVKCYAIAI